VLPDPLLVVLPEAPEPVLAPEPLLDADELPELVLLDELLLDEQAARTNPITTGTERQAKRFILEGTPLGDPSMPDFAPSPPEPFQT
jgi:hypothetical protein